MFQGIFASNDAIAQVFDIPAYISSQPTNVGRSKNAEFIANANMQPNKTRAPAAMRTCLSIDIAVFSCTNSALPRSESIPPLIIDTFVYPLSSTFYAALLARIPLLHNTHVRLLDRAL